MTIFWGILLAAVLGITFYTLMYHRMIGDYRKNYKTKVFRELVEELGPPGTQVGPKRLGGGRASTAGPRPSSGRLLVCHCARAM